METRLGMCGKSNQISGDVGVSDIGDFTPNIKYIKNTKNQNTIKVATSMIQSAISDFGKQYSEQEKSFISQCKIINVEIKMKYSDMSCNYIHHHLNSKE